MNTSTTIDFPIIYTRMKSNTPTLAIINVGRFDQWIKVNLDTVLPYTTSTGLLPIDQITKIESVVSFQVIVNGTMCSVCSLGQFVNMYNLSGTWNVQYQGYFPNNMVRSCKDSILSGPIENMMKSIDCIIKNEAKDCDMIAYVSLDNEPKITYLLRNKGSKKEAHIILNKVKSVGGDSSGSR